MYKSLMHHINSTKITIESLHSGHYLPCSASVVYPTWLLMMRCTVPPTVKCGTLASANVSATIPLTRTDVQFLLNTQFPKVHTRTQRY